MKIIDRYLLRQFIQVFLICFLSLNGLYVVLDAFSNLDEFIVYGNKEGGLLAVMGEFYAYRSIAFFERLSGVMAMISAMFTLAWIQRYNEMTALMAAGVSRVRIVQPVIFAAAAISLATAASREVLIPPLQEKIGRDSKDLLGDKAHDMHPKYDLKSDILISGRSTLGAEQRIVDPKFMMPSELEGWGHQITAENAFYQPAQDGRPAGYLLRGVRQPTEVATRKSLMIAQEQIVISPLDAKWLKPDECFVVSEIDFEQLTGGQQWKQLSSTADLVRGLSNPSLDFGADVRVAIHGRFVKPGLDMTLLLLGLPLVVARESRNIFLSIGMCVVVVSVFMMVVLACQFLGTSYLISPALAAWLPLIIFVPVAVGMFEQMRK